jgi:hypothetical protein
LWLANILFPGRHSKLSTEYNTGWKLIVLIPSWMKRTVAVFPAAAGYLGQRTGLRNH